MSPRRQGEDVLILAEALLEANLGENAEILRRFTGAELAGIRYEQLYRGVPGAGRRGGLGHAYRAIADDYVSLDGRHRHRAHRPRLRRPGDRPPAWPAHALLR